MILVYDQIPIYRRAKERESADREAAFKNSLHDICGIKIRAMSVRDLLILDAKQNPFVTSQRIPSLKDLGEFLWCLSPQIEQWHDANGWRNQWLVPSAERIEAYRFGRKVRRIPASEAGRQCFAYVETIFADRPGGHAHGGPSYVSYLAQWCDSLRSEYKCSESEIWRMPLPKLFSYLRAMELRKNPDARLANRTTTEIRQAIIRGLNEKRFTRDDVMSDDFKLN